MYLQYIKLEFNRTFEVEPGEGPVCEYDRVTVYSGSGGRHFVGECKKLVKLVSRFTFIPLTVDSCTKLSLRQVFL